MGTSFCPKCGAQIPAGFHFCGSCGAPVGPAKKAALPDAAGLYLHSRVGENVSASDEALVFYYTYDNYGLYLVKPDMTTLRREGIVPCKIIQKNGKIFCLEYLNESNTLTLYTLDMELQILEKRELMSLDVIPNEEEGCLNATMNDRYVFLVQFTRIRSQENADFSNFSVIRFDIATNQAKVFAPKVLTADGVSVCSLRYPLRLLCDDGILYFVAELPPSSEEEDLINVAILAFDSDAETLSIFWRHSDPMGEPYFFDFARRKMWTRLGYQETLTPHPLEDYPDKDQWSYDILVPRPIARNAPILAAPKPRVFGGPRLTGEYMSNNKCQYFDGTYAYGRLSYSDLLVYSGIYYMSSVSRDRRNCPLAKTEHSDSAVIVWPQKMKVFIPSYYDFEYKFLAYPMDFWHNEDFPKDSGLPPLKVKDVT